MGNDDCSNYFYVDRGRGIPYITFYEFKGSIKMKTALILYLAAGFFSYWPLVYHYKINSPGHKSPAWEWLAAWAVWTICWPYRYIQDAVYWWRAKK